MLTEEEIFIQKHKLIERVGLYFEKHEQLAPVAARILASITLTCKQGITLSQLMVEMQAGKSTVFTHLMHLEAKGRIEYFTKPGDRKRYYIPTSNGFVKFLNEKIRELEEECLLHEDVIRYKEIVNEVWDSVSGKQCNIKFNKDVIRLLKEHIALYQEWKTDFQKD